MAPPSEITASDFSIARRTRAPSVLLPVETGSSVPCDVILITVFLPMSFAAATTGTTRR